MTDEPMTVISYGGGVQSTAMIVLATQGKLGLDVTHALLGNVGDDSEHPATLSYVRELMIPWAGARGIEVLELHRETGRGALCEGSGSREWIRLDLTGARACGQCRRPFDADAELDEIPDHRPIETLYGRLMKPESRSLPIPVRMANTGAPGRRSCTRDFKIQVVGRWLRAHGATADNPATVAIGISTDEIQRMNNKRIEPYERPAYPLIDLGLSRADCMDVIAKAGLPVPPKSSCYFCPFHRPSTWAEQRRDEPVLFDRSAHLEDTLNDRRRRLDCPTSGEHATELQRVETDEVDEDGEEIREFVEVALPPGRPAQCPRCKDEHVVDGAGRWPHHHKSLVYLTRFGRPLRDVVEEAQPQLFADGHFADGGCDEGYCWT